MKHFIAFLLIFSISATFGAQIKPSKSSTSKQYRSAESGRYVTKSTAQKSPSTTYSTTRKSKK